MYSMGIINNRVASPDEFNMCGVARQVAIFAHMQAAVLASFQDGELVTAETHGHVPERQDSMTARDLRDVLHAILLHVYILDMTTKPDNLPRFMIVAYVLGATTCIIYGRDDEPALFMDECSIPTQVYKLN